MTDGALNCPHTFSSLHLEAKMLYNFCIIIWISSLIIYHMPNGFGIYSESFFELIYSLKGIVEW